MSRTEIYAVEQNGDVVAFDDVQNAWLGGMHVWDKLSESYSFNESLFQGFEKTWGAFNKGVYETFEDIVLGSTFDMVWVKKENINKLMESFIKYCDKYEGSNLLKQVEIFKEIQKDDDYIGVAWCQTSVADDLWDYGYDEDSDESIPYNINKGDKHWELFEGMVKTNDK